MRMYKKILTAMLLAVFLADTSIGVTLADPGTDDIVIKKGEQSDNVILLQMRLQDLGYYKYKITGYFGDLTKDSLTEFQKDNNLSPDGIAGAKSLDLMYSNNAKRSPVVDVNPPPKQPATAKAKTKGKLVSWKTVNSAWKSGVKCKVIDVDTNKSYYMVRVNQSYSVGHSDVAPPDKANNKIFEATYGKYYPSWYRRSVIVNIPGLGWVAGSTNGYPHGSTGILGNGMSQGSQKLQVCIHFLGSWDNCSGVVDSAHQYQIYRASGKKYKGSRSSLVYPGD
jgi:peptidoglycan hydrolase-like protein with peptidoglycan-binding domain